MIMEENQDLTPFLKKYIFSFLRKKIQHIWIFFFGNNIVPLRCWIWLCLAGINAASELIWQCGCIWLIWQVQEASLGAAPARRAELTELEQELVMWWSSDKHTQVLLLLMEIWCRSNPATDLQQIVHTHKHTSQTILYTHKCMWSQYWNIAIIQDWNECY